MYCKHCGIKLDGKTLYCPSCDRRIEYSDDNNISQFYHKPKSRVVAGLLAIILGFGVYNLYIKRVRKGTTQFFVTFTSLILLLLMIIICNHISNVKIIIYGFFLPMFFTMITAVVSHLWCIIEGILILTGLIAEDGHGNTLK